MKKKLNIVEIAIAIIFVAATASAGGIVQLIK